MILNYACYMFQYLFEFSKKDRSSAVDVADIK
jgi:hypothetical protein